MLVEDAKYITERYHDSLRRVSSAVASALLVHYTVGISRWLIPACQRAFQKSHPATVLEAQFFPLEEIDLAFSSLRPDVTIVFSFSMNERMQGEEKVSLMEDPLALVVCSDHPLAGQEKISPQELQSTSIVFVTGPSLENTTALLAQAGAEINVQRCPNVQTADNLIRCGLSAGIRTISDKNENPELCYIPIEGIAPANLYAVYRGNNQNPEIQDFIHCVRSVLWHHPF